MVPMWRLDVYELKGEHLLSISILSTIRTFLIHMLILIVITLGVSEKHFIGEIQLHINVKKCICESFWGHLWIYGLTP